jgi:hypothetical protein
MVIQVGADAVNALVQAAGQTNDALWPLIAAAIGVPLSFYIMRRLIAIIKARKK